MSEQPYDVVGWAYHAEHYSNAGIASELVAEGLVIIADPEPGDCESWLTVSGLDGIDAYDVGEMIKEAQHLKGAKFPETDDSEVYPQPVFRDQVEDWAEFVIDRVNPGASPDFVTWREAQP